MRFLTKIFKKRKKNKTAQNSIMFKKEKNTSNKDRTKKKIGIKRFFKIFKRQSGNKGNSKKNITGVKKRKKANSKRHNKNRNRKFKKFLKVIQFGFLIILAVIFIIVTIYFSTKLVLKIRDNNETNDTQSIHRTVYGFKDIPTYPQSDFIFEGDENKDSVQKFLNKGYSIYRLKPNNSISEVYDYYNEELPKKGWKKIETVPIEATDKMHGQYWLKKGNGIRIYSRINDIWYQKLSENDTRNCLANKVEEEKKRELILSQFTSTSFLPSFPWELELPGEYIITYNVAEQIEKPTHNEFLEDIQRATIQRIGTKDQYVIVNPIFIYDGGKLDLYQDKYAEQNYWEITKSEEFFNSTGRVLKVDFNEMSIEEIKEDFNEMKDEGSLENNSSEEESEIGNEMEKEENILKKEDISKAPDEAAIILQGSIRIVYSIERYGNDEETKVLYDTIIKNIKASKATL